MAVSVTYRLETTAPQTTLNGYTAGDQFGAQVAALADGGFAVSYGNALAKGFMPRVTLYTAGGDGQQGDAALTVTPYTVSDTQVKMVGQPHMIVRDDGRVMVTWYASYGFAGEDIRASTIDPVTGAVSVPDLISNSSGSDLHSVIRVNGGNIVLADLDTAFPKVNIRNATGDFVAFVGLPSPTFNPAGGAMAALSAGGFAVVVADTLGETLFLFPRAASGLSSGPTRTLRFATEADHFGSALTAIGTANGGLAMAYVSASGQIRLVTLTNTNAPTAPLVSVKADSAADATGSEPHLTVLANGLLLLTWTRHTADGDTDIMGRVFSATGQPVLIDGSRGPFVLAGGDTDASDSFSASLTTGAVVTAWTDSLSDGGGTSIQGVVTALIRESRGDEAANSIRGDALADEMYGYGGNDTLRGGAGDDVMFGGAGDDTYLVGSSGASVFEGTASGHDLVISSATFTLSTHVEDLTLTGAANIDGNGSTGANRLIGNAGSNYLWGNAGNDVLIGGAGNDTLNGGTGQDTLIGSLGDDRYVVTQQGEMVVERADQGRDLVFSYVTYGLGRDVEILVLEGSRSIKGYGNALDNLIYGNSGANLLSGSDGNDELYGGAGNDSLLGGSGADFLLGGAGRDVLTGGGGNDGFAFDAPDETPTGANRDVITDFGEGDWIDLSYMDAIVRGEGDSQNYTFVFIGTSAFSAAGQVRFADGILSGTVDADGVADFEIALTGVTALDPQMLFL